MPRGGCSTSILHTLLTATLCSLSFFSGTRLPEFTPQADGLDGDAPGVWTPLADAKNVPSAASGGTGGVDPFRINLTSTLPGGEGNLPPDFEAVRESFRPTATQGLGGVDAAYFHMLQVRAGARFHRFGSTGTIHSQWQTIYWKTRERYVRGRVGTVCEAGLGSGHSGIAMLTATTNASWYDDGAAFHSFDNGLRNEPHKKVAAYDYMTKVFGGRVTFHFGPHSSDEVRKVKESDPFFLCDIVHIDADHSKEGVMKDLDAMHSVSHKNTILFMDDYNMKGISGALEAKRDIVEIDAVYTQDGSADFMIQSAEAYMPKKVTKHYILGHFKY